MKHCIKCGTPLIVGTNWTEGRKRNWSYICTPCNTVRQQRYRTTESGSQVQHRYNVSDKGRATSLKLAREYAKIPKGIEANRRKAHKYHATEKGKLAKIKAENKRRRNYGMNILFPNPYPEHVPIEWHHINNIDVVAIAKSIHNKCKPGTVERHREKLWPLVERLYFTDDAGNSTQIV